VRILNEQTTKEEPQNLAADSFGAMVKAVVDIDRERLAVDAELHADLETLLLNEGSSQAEFWGINLYPEIEGEDFIEFDSLINIHPSQGNLSRNVESAEICKKSSDSR
jgi:hypothetical protein